ncbi:hypothetical protein BG005_001279 [Podila minutissima]|nr:hypothetical protein BG005_001279 [Podila minutissima]
MLLPYPISEEQPGETKKSGKLKQWQSKSSAKLKKWLHIDSPSKSSSEHEDNTTITPSTRRDSATTCSSRVSHEDSRSSSIGSSPNTSMPPSPALSARSVLSSFSSRPTSLPSPALKAILPPPVPARRSSFRATSRSEGRPVSTPGRITPRSSSLRVSVGSRSPPGRIPPRSSSLPRSYRSSLKRRSLLGRTLSTEIPPVPESAEEASFYAALAQVAAEVDEAIAAATEESESESTCSVRSRSSETLLLSEDEHVAHDKPVGSPRSALSPYCISPETNVPIPWSCSDVLLDRPAALELQGVEAMEEVQAMVTEQFEQYEQATTIMSYVHDIDVSVQDSALPEQGCVNDITLAAPLPPKSEMADVSIATPQDARVSDDSYQDEEDKKELAHPSTDAFEVALKLLSDDDDDILDQVQVAPIMAEAEQEAILEAQQDDNTNDVEGECAGELLDADNFEEEIQVLSREVVTIKEPTPEAAFSEDSVVEVMEEKQDETVATALCAKPLPSIHDIAQQLIDEIAFNPVIEEEATLEEEEAPGPILVVMVEEEKDQEVVIDTEVAPEEPDQEGQVEQEAMVQGSLPEPVLDLVDDYALPTVWDGKKQEEEAIVETTVKDIQIVDDTTEEPQEVVSVVEEEIAMADVMSESTASTEIETLMKEPETVAQELVKETGPIDVPLTTDIVVETEAAEEIKEDLVEDAIEIASVDELAIVVSYEDPCKDVASSTVGPYQATSPLPSPEFRPVQVDDDLEITPLVLSTVDVTPEPTVEGSIVIQEDTQQAHVPNSVAAKGAVWGALQELHPPTVSPWKRASRSPWLSVSFWLHGQ